MPADALTRIRARGHIGIRLGLARMRALLGRLGDPQLGLRGALVAGTNGKGSVVAMVASILQAARLSTCQSPSPHLSDIRERITMNGVPISAADLDAVLSEVLEASQLGEPRHGPASEFEILTAAAYLWSARQHVDVVVMEVGLGGRLDASNTWDADVAAITNVGLDHQEYLGDTVESVAAEKAAIIKAGSRAVTGARGTPLAIIEARALQLGVPLQVCQPLAVERMDLSGLWLSEPRLGSLHVPLLGRHQAHNVAVALGLVAALEEAGVARIPDEAITIGLAETRWPGRLEVVDHEGVTVVLDGAHNPDGARALSRTVSELADAWPAGRATLLMGMMADKDAAEVVATVVGSTLLAEARFVATSVPDTDRSLAAADLAAEWDAQTGTPADAALDDPDMALAHALATARGAGGMVVVAGSLYLVGHVRSRLIPDLASPRA